MTGIDAMNVNEQFQITDQQRNELAILVDGKKSKRMITRDEVREILQRHLGGLLGNAVEAVAAVPLHHTQLFDDLYVIDHDDPLSKTMAQPNNPSYVRGWNLVKRGMR